MSHNLKTMFLASKFVLPVMEKQASGVIVNLSSIAGLRMSAERHMSPIQRPSSAFSPSRNLPP
jgi:NADP-dependent 3-hydroxy acid dehydrogenase YdfG